MNDKLIAAVIQTNVHTINAELEKLKEFMPEDSFYIDPRTGKNNCSLFTGIILSLCDLVELSKALKFGGDDVDDGYYTQSQNVMLGTPIGEARR